LKGVCVWSVGDSQSERIAKEEYGDDGGALLKRKLSDLIVDIALVLATAYFLYMVFLVIIGGLNLA